MIVRFREDLLLFSKWFRRLLWSHFSDRWSLKFPIIVDTHVVSLNRVEVDVLVSDTARKKIVAIELKKDNYAKAIQQAIKRKELFDYVYVVLDLPTSSILSVLRSYSEALEHGVGFISAEDEAIVIKAYNRRVDEAARYKKILAYIQ